MITTSEELLSGPLPDVTVGIGRGSDKGHVEASAEGQDGVVIYDDPEALVTDLASGRIDAAVRGDMPSDVLLPLLKRALGLDRLERVVLMEPIGGKLFLLAPVGIDEGWTDAARAGIAMRAAGFAAAIGMDPRIAVMSGGRRNDRGRCPAVDRSLDSALEVTRILQGAGCDAYHCEILVEDAIKEAGIVIAPEGITGNIMFRTLHFVGGAKALGAPVVNADRVFVDTSRAKTDYRDSIALAKRLTEGMH